MKKEYIRPELSELSLVVEDNTNSLDDFDLNKDDSRLSIGASGGLGDLFG